jgi:hypothetical protein
VLPRLYPQSTYGTIISSHDTSILQQDVQPGGQGQRPAAFIDAAGNYADP